MKTVEKKELAPEKQKETFDILSKLFKSLFDSISPDPESLITPFWKSQIEIIKKLLLPIPPWNFLQNHAIQNLMFVSHYNGGYTDTELIKIIDGVSKELLIESEVGCPPVTPVGGIQTSGNTIHLSHHIFEWQKRVGLRVGNMPRIVEWGGGYGKMCQLIKRINPGCTYVIIDTKLFSCLQSLYLGSILGQDGVIVHDSVNAVIDGKVNIIPLSSLGSIDNFMADLFISTWALSESPRGCLDLVKQRKMFGAEHFLIAHQEASIDFPTAGDIGELAFGKLSYHKKIEFLPNNYYLFG